MPRDNEALLHDLEARLADPASTEAERATCRQRIADLRARGFGAQPEAASISHEEAVATATAVYQFLRPRDLRVRGTRVSFTTGGIPILVDLKNVGLWRR